MKDIMVGAYYFDGWTKGSPHLTKKLIGGYLDRKPIWGWETTTETNIAEQIKLASASGIDFFSFCWFHDPKKDSVFLGSDFKNTALGLFLKVNHHNKIGYNLLIANHSPYYFKKETWPKLIEHWIEYFATPSYVKINGKPLITFFSIESLLTTFGGTNGVKEALELLRLKAIENGFSGATVAICVGSDPQRIKQAQACGFDVLTGYNYHSSGLRSFRDKPVHVSEMEKREKLVWDKLIANSNLQVVPTITLNWDRRPWDKNEVLNTPRFTGFSGQSVRNSIYSCRVWMQGNRERLVDEKLAMIYAWNEYGEGSWLTPSIKMKQELLNGLIEGLNKK